MEERKWEDMNADCLANIFGRLELQSRVLAIPLVCKPWYQAVSNPLCWEQLIFPPMFTSPSSQTELIKFVVKRSQRCATSLALPYVSDREVLIYISEELPALKVLVLHEGVASEHQHIIPSLIVKWKNLQSLTLGGNITFITEILEHIHIHLPKFSTLCLKNADFDGEMVSAIVSEVPKLKCLILNGSILPKAFLLLILQGCKELEYLDVRNCAGFNEDDEEILRLSSGIKNFQCDGSAELDLSDFDVDDSDLAQFLADIANNIAEYQLH